MSGRRAGALAAVAALVGSLLLVLGVRPAAAAPASDAATVHLAGFVDPPAPDADVVETLTIPLTVTNTSDATLYDVGVSSLRSAPVTTGDGLTTALRGGAVEESDATTRGRLEPLADPLPAGASVRVDYVVDTSSDRGSLCLCFLGTYALDLLVTAADEPGGETATVARTQTYLPSLLQLGARADVGWLWPLLDRPHRLTSGSVFTDDDLAASVADGGRLDRALQVVESVDASAAGRAGASRSMLLLLDPEILDELVTMTGGYTVQPAGGGAATAGTGEQAAREWLARLAAVVPRHDLRFTAPGDPDLVGLAARGVGVAATPDQATATRIESALGLPTGRVLPHDLAWPVESDLDPDAIAALVAAGARGVVTTADTDDDGAVASLAAGGGGSDTTPALLADPDLTEAAGAAIGLGRDNANALQRLVVTAAMTSVEHPDDTRAVLVVPDRDLDVAPAAAVRAVLATAALGTPTSPLDALGAGPGVTRSDLLTATQSPPPATLAAALDAARAAADAVATTRATVVSGAEDIVGDLVDRIPRAVSNSWPSAPDVAATSTADLATRARTLAGSVQVVVRATGSYSLASADAPLLLTVANNLPVAVRVRVDVRAAGRANGFEAGTTQTQLIPAQSRPTIQVPTRVTRSGRFQAEVALRTADGAVVGTPATITVTSTAVGTVGRIVTYSAGALLVLALLVRGVRRLVARARAGSAGTGPTDTSATDGDRAGRTADRADDPAGGPSTVPSRPT